MRLTSVIFYIVLAFFTFSAFSAIFPSGQPDTQYPETERIIPGGVSYIIPVPEPSYTLIPDSGELPQQDPIINPSGLMVALLENMTNLCTTATIIPMVLITLFFLWGASGQVSDRQYDITPVLRNRPSSEPNPESSGTTLNSNQTDGLSEKETASDQISGTKLAVDDKKSRSRWQAIDVCEDSCDDGEKV